MPIFSDNLGVRGQVGQYLGRNDITGSTVINLQNVTPTQSAFVQSIAGWTLLAANGFPTSYYPTQTFFTASLPLQTSNYRTSIPQSPDYPTLLALTYGTPSFNSQSIVLEIKGAPKTTMEGERDYEMLFYPTSLAMSITGSVYHTADRLNPSIFRGTQIYGSNSTLLLGAYPFVTNDEATPFIAMYDGIVDAQDSNVSINNYNALIASSPYVDRTGISVVGGFDSKLPWSPLQFKGAWVNRNITILGAGTGGAMDGIRFTGYSITRRADTSPYNPEYEGPVHAWMGWDMYGPPPNYYRYAPYPGRTTWFSDLPRTTVGDDPRDGLCDNDQGEYGLSWQLKIPGGDSCNRSSGCRSFEAVVPDRPILSYNPYLRRTIFGRHDYVGETRVVGGAMDISVLPPVQGVTNLETGSISLQGNLKILGTSHSFVSGNVYAYKQTLPTTNNPTFALVWETGSNQNIGQFKLAPYGAGGGGSAIPGGVNRNVQFNDNNAFEGASTLNWYKATNVLDLAGQLTIGTTNTASNSSVALGATNTSNLYSLTVGSQNLAISSSLAQGTLTTASKVSHAEGFNTQASGLYSHAEGIGTVASGLHAHAEGSMSIALGTGSHAEGLHTIASGSYQHVQGQYNLANTASLFIIGDGTSNASRHNLLDARSGSVLLSGSLYVQPGQNYLPLASRSVILTYDTTTGQIGLMNTSSIQTGGGSTTNPGGVNQNVQFNNNGVFGGATRLNYVSSSGALILSGSLTVSGSSHNLVGTTRFTGSVIIQPTSLPTVALASGNSNPQIVTVNTTTGQLQRSQFVETDPVFVAARPSLATTGSNLFRGAQTISSSLYIGILGSATGNFSMGHGNNVTASGAYSYAQGQTTTASGSGAHAEGLNTRAEGQYSHAQGRSTTSSGDYSFASGYRVEAAGDYQQVFGVYNVANTESIFQIGVGNNSSNGRRNGLNVTTSSMEFSASIYLNNGVGPGGVPYLPYATQSNLVVYNSTTGQLQLMTTSSLGITNYWLQNGSRLYTAAGITNTQITGSLLVAGPVTQTGMQTNTVTKVQTTFPTSTTITATTESYNVIQTAPAINTQVTVQFPSTPTYGTTFMVVVEGEGATAFITGSASTGHKIQSPASTTFAGATYATEYDQAGIGIYNYIFLNTAAAGGNAWVLTSKM